VKAPVNGDDGDREPLLRVHDLRVRFTTKEGVVRAVDGVDFTLARGHVLAIVGESGSGKSVTAMTILGLTRGPRTEFEGEVRYSGRNLLTLSEPELRHYRGGRLAMIFQDPMTSLNPVRKVGDQIVEAIRVHESIDRAGARNRAVDLLKDVGIPNPAQAFKEYPHRFSGGMRQRAMIAMALACNPDILIADEPTTALDVTIQAQIIELIQRLRAASGSSVILITHDLGVVADIADDVAVMYAGRIVETASRRKLFYDPQHPYTWGLLASIPRLDGPKLATLPSIEGNPPSLIDVPEGCKFRPRCPFAMEQCAVEPELAPRTDDPSHLDRCWLSPDEKRMLRVQESGGIAATS
jgi:oligopeptide/dipeptide ABC transporter ATP-binding protein